MVQELRTTLDNCQRDAYDIGVQQLTVLKDYVETWTAKVSYSETRDLGIVDSSRRLWLGFLVVFGGPCCKSGDSGVPLRGIKSHEPTTSGAHRVRSLVAVRRSTMQQPREPLRLGWKTSWPAC